MQYVFIIFIQNKQKYSTKLFSVIDQSRQIEKQISPALIILNCHISEKKIREKWKFYEFLVRGIKKLIGDSRITNP